MFTLGATVLVFFVAKWANGKITAFICGWVTFLVSATLGASGALPDDQIADLTNAFMGAALGLMVLAICVIVHRIRRNFIS